MKRISQHTMLVHGDTFEHCMDQINRFFKLTTLVVYDKIEVNKEFSISSHDENFWFHLEKAEQKNRSILNDLIEDLQTNGVNSLEDIGTIEQGFVSKIFHILSHFVDGFIGVDSFFYNLLDDSHWLPDKTKVTIKEVPDGYWLIHLECYATGPEEVGLLHL